MVECHAVVETEKASKYLQQLCKHFAHKVKTDFDKTTGRVEFPPGLCYLTADEQTLNIFCQSEQDQGLLVMQGIIDSHLIKFAWREELTIDWQSSLPEKVPPVVMQDFVQACA